MWISFKPITEMLPPLTVTSFRDKQLSMNLKQPRIYDDKSDRPVGKDVSLILTKPEGASLSPTFGHEHRSLATGDHPTTEGAPDSGH